TIDVGYAHLNNRAFISRYQGFADHNLLIEYDLNSLQRLLEYEISEQIGVPRANLAGDEIFLSTAAGIQRFPADLSPQAMLPIVGRLACDDLVDDFGSAATGWPVVNTPALLARYLSGEYQIVVRQPSALHAFRSPSLCIFQNYHVGADVHWQGPGGNSYGIIFGMYQGFQRFYIFDMNATLRQFRLLYYDGNGYQQIVSPRFSSSIVPDSGVNHLLVEVENQRVVLRINGTAVAILDALSGVEQPTSAGILVSSGIDSTDPDVRFDNFQFVKIADAGVGTPLAMTGHDLAEQPVWITISEAENPVDNLLLWPE
ncbi:MAG: hypothetical protein KDE04_16355, partial [Anaerolineales bacterium]|nr:hypothetical protein [Anaerolineales bacterium]